jgi:hypothetical protein
MKTKSTKTRIFSSLDCLPLNNEGHHESDKAKYVAKFVLINCPHCNKDISINNSGFRQDNKRIGHCPECSGYIEIGYEMKVITEMTIEIKKLCVVEDQAIDISPKLYLVPKEEIEKAS